MPSIIGLRQLDAIASDVRKRNNTGKKGGCLVIRGGGQQSVPCYRMTRKQCNEFNLRLQAFDIENHTYHLQKGCPPGVKCRG